MKKKIIISLVVVGGFVFSYFQYYYLASKPAAGNIPEVELYNISPAEKIFINGLIEPIESAEIYTDPSKGSVSNTYVTNGQIVQKGDLLFEYSNSSITEQIEQLNLQIEAQYKEIEQLKVRKENSNQKLAEQQKKLKEQERLLAEQEKQAEEQQKLTIETPNPDEELNLEGQQGSVEQQPQATQQTGVTTSSLAGLDTSVLSGEIAALENEISAFGEQITSIQNQVATVEKQKSLLKDKEVTKEIAPISGKVILNDLTTTQSPYLLIESTEYYVNGTISEKDLPKLAVGQHSEILVHSTNATITGKIEYIGDRPVVSDLSSNMANGNNNVSNYLVKIKLDSQENLINGYHVQANVKLSESEMKIPRNAILEGEKGTSYVYKVVGKEYIKQDITYSEEDSEEASVISGLKENDIIVFNPSSVIEKEEGKKK
jgi:HlyD family secretion protein